MQDKIPGLAPEPKMRFPLPSLGMTERLSRPILDHILLGTLHACITSEMRQVGSLKDAVKTRKS